LRKYDFITGLVLIVFSAALIIASADMLKLTLNSGRPWYMSSGLFPLLTGGGLFVLALLLVKAAAGAARELSPSRLWREMTGSQAARTFFFVTGLSALYIAVMRFSYPAATVLYVFILARYAKQRSRLAALLAAAATAAIIALFYGLAKIPLP
jgi:hypothetical protein